MTHKNKFYIINYVAGEKFCPYFFEVKWDPELPVIDYASELPLPGDLSEKYSVIADLPELLIDYLPDQFLASENVTLLCESLDTEVIVRPVDIALNNNVRPLNNYFFFLPRRRVSFVDEVKSEFILSRDRYTGLPAVSIEQDGEFPVYEKIDRLIVDPTVCCDLFFAREIKKVVCSERFVEMFHAEGLSGVVFEEIDENYRYAPWDDFGLT